MSDQPLMIQLRPHQQQAVNAMWDNDRGQIIVPTGGGKTICMIDDAKTMMQMGIQYGKTFVVVAPVFSWQNNCALSFLS